ncbi:MAG: DUF6798 domain-containing protein, partial [Vicinamibacterales bacterium]
LELRFLTCAGLLIFLTESGPWRSVVQWGGLADQYAYGGYLQPSEFGIAILAACAFANCERRHLAVACLVVAAWFHASYLLACGAVALGLAVERGLAGHPRQGIALLSAFGLCVLPMALYGLTFGGDPRSVALSREILTEHLIPQHAWPRFWLSAMQCVKLGIMCAGTLAAFRLWHRSVAFAMTAALLMIAGGILFVYLTGNRFVALLFPWRASVFLYPLSLLALSAVGADILTTLAGAALGSERTSQWLRLGTYAVALLLVAESARELTLSRYSASFSFPQTVARSARPDDVTIVPVTDADIWNRFRLLSMRPIYVDRKSHPYGPAEVLEWKQRVDDVAAMYALPSDARPRRCSELGARFYVDSTTAWSTDVDESTLRLVSCQIPPLPSAAPGAP